MKPAAELAQQYKAEWDGGYCSVMEALTNAITAARQEMKEACARETCGWCKSGTPFAENSNQHQIGSQRTIDCTAFRIRAIDTGD